MSDIEIPSYLKIPLKTRGTFGIWTGGPQTQNMTSLNATSLLGGLRFWTEALLRADGRQVCTKQERCTYDKDKADKTCEMCKIFGCTGISRAFSMKVNVNEDEFNKYLVNPKEPMKIPLEEKKYFRNGRTVTPTYYLKYGFRGHFDIELSMRRPLDGKSSFILPENVLTALYLMIEYGTMGANDQYGSGIVDFVEESDREFLRKICLKHISAQKSASRGVSLRDFFFFKGKVITSNVPKSVPRGMCLIRNSIREGMRQSRPELRHWFCGSLKQDQKNGNNSGSKYVMGVDEMGCLYGWGFYPRDHSQYGEERDFVLDLVRKSVRNYAGEGYQWIEFAPEKSSKDMDWNSFFTSLLGEKPWRNVSKISVPRK